MEMDIHNMLIKAYINKSFDKFWLLSNAFIVGKDHFNQKLTFWPQVLFKKIL